MAEVPAQAVQIARRLLRALVLVCAALLWSGVAGAQTTGAIRGEVRDPSGAVVQDAVLTATLAGTDTSRSVSSGPDGTFELPELPVGNYALAAEARGFKKFAARDVAVTIGHVAIVSVALEVGGSTETVTVQADAVQVESTSTQLGAVMSETAVRELPLSSRDTYQLLQLQPGVQSQVGADLFYGSDNAGVVSVNGGRGRSNNYMVNGGDGNDIFANGPAIQPSPDAIEQFRVITNTFDAEYGRNSGSVVNVVTKSGTNNLHGDFYEFFRNDVLNTRSIIDKLNNQNAPTLEYKQNQFGATLGAPVKKDRTFIFGSYEGNRLRKGINAGTVLYPTASERAGDFSATGPAFVGTLVDDAFATLLANRTSNPSNPGRTCQQAVTAIGGQPIAAGTLFSAIFPNNRIPVECFDPTAVAIYDRWVAPFAGSCDSLDSCNLPSIDGQRDRRDQFTIRFDHKITNSQQFSAYFYFEDDDRTDPFSTFQGAGANVPGFGALFKTRTQQWNLSHTWTIGSDSVNEFRFNYFREGQGNLNHPLNILPSVHDSCGSALVSTCFTDPANPSAGITSDIPGRQGVPSILITGGFSIGNNNEGELPQTGNTFQWTDNFTKAFSKHTVKFGGDVRRQRFDQFLYFDINGFFTFLSDSNLCVSGPATSCDAPSTNDVGFSSAYPGYFLGTSSSYTQGAAQGQNDRNTALYLFAQDSWKLKSNLTLNYGLRWELNTPYYDRGNRLQTFRPGQATSQFPCWMSQASADSTGLSAGDCGPGSGNDSIFPYGLVFPGDTGVSRGLTSTYYKAFAPRIGLAWSPSRTDGWLAKLTGGPGKSSIRAGYGIFYNPIEQLVLEQFSAEPPFGGSASLTNTLFNLPFQSQSGGNPFPNVFGGIIHQTPATPCASDFAGGPAGCVDWSQFRPILLAGEFQPHLRSQYSEQYNLTIERQLTKDMLLRVAYVGTQAHHLLAIHDLNPGNAQTCLDLQAVSEFYATSDPGLSATYACGPFGADNAYSLPAGSLPSGFTVHLPYGPNSSVAGGPESPAITLVGLRPYSSPICQPIGGSGCPPDGVPVFSNIFAEDTIANSNYNGLQVSVERNLSKGLLFQASYTYSKAIDQGASFENELNPLDFRATRGLSLVDARHRFVFSPYWELPISKLSGAAGKFANGWAVSAIITYQSGFPIRMQTQDDLELQSSYFFEDANTPQIDGRVQFVHPKTSNTFQWFDPSNISDPAPGTFGNMPHSLCCGPAISNTDFSIEKHTAIGERWSTEFRAEFYNLWNHTQFANPDGNFSDTTFGQIQKTREDPRVIQFALKFLF
ncbi:MAG: carboxypeptidase regulatory-like domain-containing protein [Acidobacteriia bacterium]|nr:carboxypeptidase regulatory-like domain-containing protein [Terriglobia bacterium]